MDDAKLTVIVTDCTSVRSVHISRRDEIDIAQLEHCRNDPKDIDDFFVAKAQIFHCFL